MLFFAIDPVHPHGWIDNSQDTFNITAVHPAVLMGLHGISYSWRSDYCGAHMKTYCSSICGYPGIACVKGHLPLLL